MRERMFLRLAFRVTCYCILTFLLQTVILNVLFSSRKEGTDLPSAIKQHRFESCLEILRRRYGNAGMKASSLCSDIRLRCLRPTIWSSTSKVNSL
jgi:hypothetical protein